MKQFKDMVFIEQLQELKSTLQEAMQAENVRLDMGLWVTSHPQKPKHFCASACCIMGYQAVKEADRLVDIVDYASWLSNVLENTKNPGTKYLAQSIYYSRANMRKDRARHSGLFNDSELNSINHLNKNDPSFQDAIGYLDLCIEKVNSYLACQLSHILNSGN